MKFKITHQGKPVVNMREPTVVAQGEGFIAFVIDMVSKWCEVDATCCASDGGLSLHVGTTDRSCHLDEEREHEWTEIQFQEYNCDDWDIFVASITRYSLSVVLVKR